MIYTVSQLAEHWQVSLITIRRLMKYGKLKAIKVGKNIRIKEEWVKEYEKIYIVNTKNE